MSDASIEYTQQNRESTPKSPLSEKRLRLLALVCQRDDVARRLMDRICPRKDPGPPRPSYAQQRLWFLDQLVPGSPFYNVPAAIRLRGPIDADILRATFNEILQRHEVLRTAFSEVEGKPFPLILPGVEIPLKLVDLRHLSPSLREREALRLAEEDARTPFDLRHVPLIRTGLIRLDENDYIFLVNIHHIVADGWSMGILTEEFRQIYAAFAQGRPSPLPPLKIQYADFASWQRSRIEGGQLQHQLDYWLRKLALLPELDLPTDFPRRSVQNFEGNTLHVTLPLELTEQLKQFGRTQNVTLFVTLFAAFNALLHRYTGQDEIVIGEPIANRNHVEIEPLIGFFVNSLVLRTDVSGDPTFLELLQRSREVVLEADENQDIPFELLVERLSPERNMGKNPLFQVSLQFFSGIQADGRQPMLSADAIHVEKGTAGLDLAFDLIEIASGLLVRVEYSTELFTKETVSRIVSHYRNLLEAFVQNPNLRVSKAPMLSTEETNQMLQVWSGDQHASQDAEEPVVCIHELFERQASATPDAVAIEGASRQLTYQQTAESARRLANRLALEGVGPETIVATCMERSVDAIISVLAVWMAGGAYVPLDPSQPESRIGFLIDDAKPRLILTRTRHLDELARFGVPCIAVDVDSSAEHSGVSMVVAGPDRTSGPENLAYIIYTSGSAGGPKGVMVEHSALARHLQWMQSEFPLLTTDKVLFKYSFHFDVSLLEMIAPLLSGARVIVPRSDPVTDINSLARLIRDRGVTVLDVVPSMLAALLDSPVFASSRSVRRVFCGGEVLPPDLLNRMLDRMPVEFCNMYGPTETTITATFWRCEERRDLERIPIGRPVGHARAYVLDPYLNPLPPLVPGELWIGGGCLARGYLNRSELTRERFIHDPFANDPLARLYRTGDRCRFLPDGNLDFLGRVDDQVKIRGFRVELGEVEAVLGASPLVRGCAAAIKPDSQGRNQLVAYVVPNKRDPEFWPSVGEYFVYDELLYHAMTNDRVRNQAYRRVIDKAVRGKAVVDIGSGADLALARMCLEAGARRVYAIEIQDRAFKRACRLAEELSCGERLMLLHGDSRAVSLPEKVDVCVSELIGTIGSSEGVIELINNARRFLKPGGEMIPHRCITRLAAVSLPGGMISAPHFTDVPRFYADRIFEKVGRKFDIRLCVRNLPANALVSDSAVFEDLSFERILPRESSTDVELRITRNARLDGLLLWINLFVDVRERLDVLTSEMNWLPAFLPVFSPGIEVEAGDSIKLACSRLVEKDKLTPDYLLRGSLLRKGQVVHEFDYWTPRDEDSRGRNPFYQALLESNPAQTAASLAHEERRVGDWERLYERLYAEPAMETSDPSFNIVGWNSSYTGEPISDEEMREQVEGTVDRIRALGGRRVLEIGCGSGLLLLRLAPDSESYLGTDFAPNVVATLRRVCQRRGLYQVQVLERRADDFSGIEPGSMDGVVLNSVVQYFPGIEYLMRVLSGACRVVRPGGWIFLGDVRSLPLLKMLHAGVELARAGVETSLEELRERIRARAEREPELVLDPEFFAAWAQASPSPGGWIVEVKRGRHHNELTKFRYDVTLHVGSTGSPASRWEELHWSQLGAVASLRDYLRTRRPVAVCVREVPSARLAPERLLLELIERSGPEMTVSQLRHTLEQAASGGVEPELLWSLRSETGYEVRVGWSEGSPHRDGCYDVWCLGTDEESGRAWHIPIAPRQRAPWESYANPVPALAADYQLAEQLRSELRRKLPDYMLPNQIVWMDRLPLTSSGKVNRRALPAPEIPRLDPTTVYTAPRNQLETWIAAVWSQILGVDRIGVDTNFFNLGGHSLLATQVISRLTAALETEVPLRLMFEHPTIASLAEAILRLRKIAPPVALVTNSAPNLDGFASDGFDASEVEPTTGRLAL